MVFSMRSSPFKHVFGTAAKPEACVADVRMTKNSYDSDFSAVNATYVAVAWDRTGGAFAIIPRTFAGRLEHNHPTFTGHTGPVLSLAFNPFNDSEVASGAEDSTIRLWTVPDVLDEDVKESRATLEGHTKKVVKLRWHPTVSNILASCSQDGFIKIWNTTTGECLQTLDGHGEIVFDAAWNKTGTKLATVGKDKKLRIWNPRTGELEQETPSHDGFKTQHVVWMTDKNLILTVGGTRMSERQVKLYDETDISKTVLLHKIDESGAVLIPFYDVDTGLLFLSGKGDSAVMYFEFSEDGKKIYPIGTFRSGTVGMRGFCVVPKRACDFMKHEIASIIKIEDSKVIPISFVAPRKSQDFQADLFPPAYAGKAEVDADDWFANGTEGPYVTVDLQTLV